MLQIGAVGIGKHCWPNILPCIAQIHDVVLVAACDINMERANIAAQKYGAKAYYDYKHMIAAEKLDAVIVASEPDVHYEVAKLALEKKISVFVEKAPTFTLEELEELISINNQCVTTGVGLNFNYAETVKMIDELSANKDFGNIVHLSISHYSCKPRRAFWNKSLENTFQLVQSIHPVGFMTRYGETVKSYHVDVINKDNNIFISGNFLLENKNGNQVIANLTTGNMSPHFLWRIELVTDKSIIVRIDSLSEIEIFDANKQTHLISETKRWKDTWNPSPIAGGYAQSGYLGEFNAFFNCVRNKKQFDSSFESLVPVYKILNILDESLYKKRVQRTKSHVKEYPRFKTWG